MPHFSKCTQFPRGMLHGPQVTLVPMLPPTLWWCKGGTKMAPVLLMWMGCTKIEGSLSLGRGVSITPEAANVKLKISNMGIERIYLRRPRSHSFKRLRRCTKACLLEWLSLRTTRERQLPNLISPYRPHSQGLHPLRISAVNNKVMGNWWGLELHLRP